MAEIIPMIGKKFNRWTVIEKIEERRSGHVYYKCRCDCGFFFDVAATSLKSGKSTKCFPCLSKHKLSGTPTYKIWIGILTRCNNPKVRIYKYYGGRGIKVCERWFKFENFYEDMGERPSNLQIDRIDNEKGYSPDNCRWVTAKENNPFNKGTNKDDMPGKIFGTWNVVKRVIHKPAHRYYLCRCSCGAERIISGAELRRGKTNMCIKCKHISHRGWGKRRNEATTRAQS